MLFTKPFVAAILATTASAAAVKRDANWTIRDTSRACAGDYSSCTWSFTIDNNMGDQTGCTFVTYAHDGQGADRASGGPSDCGVYQGITSGWSGQFGDGNGFTTFAAKRYDHNVIGFFSFTDAEVANGQHVGARDATVQGL